MKKLPLFALLIALSLTPSRADLKTPVYHLTTVSWVVATRDNLNADDRFVTLIGHLVKKDGDDFWFTDGTGSVRLDPEKFNLPIGPKIVVGGRIDQAFLGIGHLEVDVKEWRFVKNP